jgi:hypothetical protein
MIGSMSEKVAIWIQCHTSMVGKVYGEVVRHNGVIQRQTTAGELCSVLVRLPQGGVDTLSAAVSTLHPSVVVTPA